MRLSINQGYLDAATDAVTITIGGNDARFAPVLKSCSLHTPTTDCSGSGYVMDDDPQPLNQYEPHILKDLMPAHLEATYRAIHAAAPNARIFVVGYPKLFPPGGQESCSLNLTIDATDQAWIDDMTDLMDETIKSTVTKVAATGTNIFFVDPRSAFAGHDMCQAGDGSYVNGVINYSTDAMGTHVPGTGSYHPKANGQRVLADLVTKSMATNLPKK